MTASTGPVEYALKRETVNPDPVPTGRDDGSNRVATGARRLLQAVLAADPELDGFYAGQSVVGLIAQEYEGGAIKELIQNAHDQLDAEGRIHVLLHDDDGGQPVLYVANEGQPFSDENFRAILRIAASSKTPGSSIGFKGVGFKAVLTLSASPEVYSSSKSAEPDFRGYRFRFGRYEDLVAAVGEDGAQTFVERLPASAFAVPIPNDASPLVAEFGANGYATVVRIPLDQPGAADKVVRELEELASGAAPPQLFLERVSTLILERRGPEPQRLNLTRSVRPLAGASPTFPGRVVDLGTLGEFAVARRHLDSAKLAEAIRLSIERQEIDPRWKHVVGPLTVEVAVRIDHEPEPGRLYAFLPMSAEEASPVAGHLNAPFATRLARDRVRFEVPLNAMLVRECAAAAVEAARCIRSEGSARLRPLAADFVAWHGSHADAMREAIEAGGATDLIPTIDRGGLSWNRLDQLTIWRDDGLVRLRAADMAELSDARLADPALGSRRLERLHQAARDAFGHDPSPDPATMAAWAEQIAAAMKARRRTRAATWMDFYDDLATLFASNATALEGRRILLTEQNELAACGRRGRLLASKAAPVVFFPPTLGAASEEEDEADVGVEGHVPASLPRRIAFMHPDLVWTPFNKQTRAREMRPAREFFAAKQLVRPYQAEDILLLIRDVVASSNDRRIHADALRFTFVQASGRGLPAEPRLESLGLRVPGKSGRWLPASTATFGAEWRGTNGVLLERVVAAWKDDETMSRVHQSLLAPPDDWPRHRLPKPNDTWLDFLRRLGVRDGLWPHDAKHREVTGSGWDFQDRTEVARRAGISGTVANDWVEAARRLGRNPYYTTVGYMIEGPIPVLPGQATHDGQDLATRLLYGRLLAASLGRWPAWALEVEIRRPRNAPSHDSVRWPSPVRGFLERRAWVPVTLPRAQAGGEPRPEELSTTRAAWFFEDSATEQPPSFVPLISADVRRRIASEELLRERLDELGMRVWGRPEESIASLSLMVESFERFGVLGGLELGFRRAYQQAWSHVVRSTERADAGSVPTRLIVTVGNRLEVIDLAGPEGEVWILGTTDRLTETLLRAVERPVLVADAADGLAIHELLATRWGDRISAVSLGDTQVIVNGQVVEPSGDRERLIDRVGPWLAELVALTLELRATTFNRQTIQSVRQAIDRLRRVRLAEADHFELRVRGVPVATPPAFRAAVPADDDAAPTLVLVPEGSATWDGLRSVAPALAELIHRGFAGPALRDVLVDLGRVIGTEELAVPTAEEYAAAFGEPVERIRAHLADHRGSLDELLFAVRPLIAVFADVDAARSFDPGSADRESVVAALAQVEEVGMRAEELVDAASRLVDLAELRDHFGVSVADFNAALRRLGDPYRPLRYEQEAWRALERWLLDHRRAVFDALRSAFADEFARLGLLDHYSRAASAVDSVSTPGRRDLTVVDGLGPEPAWAETYTTPPPELVDARVTEWLATYGAFLGTTYDGLDRDQRRAGNSDRLAALLPSLALTVAAWATKHGLIEAPDWVGEEGAALLRQRLYTEGWLDFTEIDTQWVIRWLESRGLWPSTMPRTSSLSELDLASSDLDVQRSDADRRRAQEARRQRSVLLDDAALSLDDRLDDIVRKVLAGIAANPAPLGAKVRAVKLKPMPQGSRRGGRGGSGGKGWDRLLTDDQKSLIGLIGEIAAYEWLDRQIGLTPRCWRSTNRTSRFDDDPGDDSVGFDIAVPERSSTHYFEVKATTGDGSEATIELTPAEARFARSQIRGRYNVLLVTNVLDSSRRRFHVLPNPFSPESVDLFRVRNRGFRFTFRL